jgi:hypothetical protein
MTIMAMALTDTAPATIIGNPNRFVNTPTKNAMNQNFKAFILFVLRSFRNGVFLPTIYQMFFFCQAIER